MNPTTYYLSGPMSGLPNMNVPAFAAAAKNLREADYQIVSPHEHGTEKSWAESLRNDILLMMTHCSGLILLKGWQKSAGANLELAIALALKWPVQKYLPKVNGWELTPWSDEKRTSAQNRYLHAEPFKKIADHTGDSVEKTKFDLMGTCWGWEPSKLTGQLVPVKLHTSKMSVVECTTFIDWLLPWAQDFFEGAVDIQPPTQWFEAHPEARVKDGGDE